MVEEVPPGTKSYLTAWFTEDYWSGTLSSIANFWQRVCFPLISESGSIYIEMGSTLLFGLQMDVHFRPLPTTFNTSLDSSGTHFWVAKTSQSSSAHHLGRIKVAEPPQRLLNASPGNPVLDPSPAFSWVLRDASSTVNSFQPYPHILRLPGLYLLWHLGSSNKNYEEVLATIFPPESKYFGFL